MSINIDRTKELLNSYRNLSNHTLVLLVTVGAGVVNFAIKKDFNIWFFLGTIITILELIIYVSLKVAEFKELKRIEE